MEEKVKAEDLTNLDWIQLRKEINSGHPTETQKDKFLRKFSENPMVPIGKGVFLRVFIYSRLLGCLATTFALSYGLYSFRRGNQKMSQNMMRTRVGAQALTVVALIGGVLLGTTSFSRE